MTMTLPDRPTAGHPPEPAVESVTVTPELAESWLARNTLNRRLRLGLVDRYARDMAAGRWQFDGTPIKFGADGALLDGQHRLRALVEAGTTLPFVVIRGLPPEAQRTMDTGAKRTVGDQLKLRGLSNPDLLASVARFALRMRGDTSGQRILDPTPSEIHEWVEANPRYADATAYYAARYFTLPLMPTVGVYALLALTNVGGHVGGEFFEGLLTRANLPKGSPILVLDARLHRGTSKGHRGRIEQLSLVYRAWNHWVAGQSISKLQLAMDEGGVVRVPEPVNHPAGFAPLAAPRFQPNPEKE